MFGGFGPIVCGIVYAILSASIDNFTLSGTEVLLGIISTYLLAFIQAGASIFNQIEHWPIAKALSIHFLCLYISYTGCYILNSWIPFEPVVLSIFTAIFAIAYLVICGIVYLSIKILEKKFNEKLNKQILN